MSAFEILKVQKESESFSFVVRKNGETGQIKAEAILERRWHEFAEWKWSLTHSSLASNSGFERGKKAMPQMVTYIIRGFLNHNQYSWALDTLMSAQYGNCIPPADLLRQLLKECPLRCTDPNIFVRLQNYFTLNISDGSWDEHLEGLSSQGLFTCNGEGDCPTFWDNFKYLVESEGLSNSQLSCLLQILGVLVERLVTTKKLESLVTSLVSDRRQRRRFIVANLLNLIKITEIANQPMVTSIISMTLMSVILHKEHFDNLMDELFETSKHLDHQVLVSLLRDLDSFIGIELVMLILERRYHWGDQKIISILPRLMSIIEDSFNVSQEGKSSKPRKDHFLPFTLLCKLIMNFITFCTVSMEGDCKYSLLSNSMISLLVRQLQKLKGCPQVTASQEIKMILPFMMKQMEEYRTDLIFLD